MLPRASLFRPHGPWAALVVATSGCGDLFHTTDWPLTCDDASDCAPGSSSGAGADGGSGAMSGAGGLGAQGSGAGSGSGGGSAGGAGGSTASGGAGGGPCSTCNEVAQAVLNGTPSPDPATLCPGAAQEAWDAVYACTCESRCLDACNASACQLQQASGECTQCAANNCLGPLRTCEHN